MKLAALAAVLLVARVVAAEPEAGAEHAFREATARSDITALEQLGAARPVTRWTDDAWSEAARLAVRANDYDRARRALEQVIAVGSDPQLVRRARAELARIASFAGGTGEWNAVAAKHERLAPGIHAGGDPRPALEQLEALVRAHPRYPRAPMLMVAIARGWEREGEADRALEWLRRAKAAGATREETIHASAELVRVLVRVGDLDAAEAELAELARTASAGLVHNLRKMLDKAELRRTVRWIMLAVLAVLAGLAAFSLRRTAGSWRAALRRLARPPSEAVFLVPIGVVICAFSYTGNPLIARTVVAIMVAGIATSWLSGAVLDAQPRVRLARVLVHAAIVVIATVAAVYLAVDRGHVIDFVIETWRSGHE